MPSLTPCQRRLRWGMLAGAALAVSLPVFKNFFPSIPSLPCGFYAVTGLPCLFCGGTRSACAAIQGDFVYSLYLNSLSIPTLLAIALLATICMLEILRGRPLANWRSVSLLFFQKWPIILLLLLTWWSVHLITALRTPKTELVNSQKPIAAQLRAWLNQ